MKKNSVATKGKAKGGPGRPKGPPRHRVHVTLSRESWLMVEEISKLTGTPKASVLSEIFHETLPAFMNTVEALRVAKEHPREAQRLISNFAAESMLALNQHQLDFDKLVSAEEAKKPKKKAKKGAARAGST